MDINIGCLRDYYPEHKHKYYEILIYTNGSGTLKTDASEIPFSQGSIVVIPPDTLHCSVCDGPFERIYLSGNLDKTLNLSAPTLISEGTDSDGMILAQLIYQNRFKKTDYLNSLINAFTSFILQGVKIKDKIDEEINSVINKIIEGFSDYSLNVTEFLRNSGYSEDYIRDRFKKSTGKTPVRFLTEIRISHACLLIDFYKNSISLSEIAEKCGYTDYIYFTRRFKEITGMSPREYMHQA